MIMELVLIVFGFVLGLVTAYVWTAMHIRGSKPRISGKTLQTVMVAALFVGLMVAQVAVSYAQTATPVPLNIPTNQIFTETNSWMATFAPVAAIGIGISIALAVLGYLGKMIKSAFN